MIYHYYGGGSSGVFRFNQELRRVFPEMHSVSDSRIDVTCNGDIEPNSISMFTPDDVVITDNHCSLDVPDYVKTIVVHHGCAQTHYDRDAAWRNPTTRLIVERQREMFSKPNRTYVAPSWWVGQRFMFVCPKGTDCQCKVIPHWVERMELTGKSERPVIIGDWRDFNKGAAMWRRLAMACPRWEFAPLAFRTQEEKARQYGCASLYLCLSLSEGGSYSMCDAEAASLPIVTTDVGNYREFTDCEVIPWQERDNLEIVIAAIERKLAIGRVKPSFYDSYSLEMWRAKWEATIQ